MKIGQKVETESHPVKSTNTFMNTRKKTPSNSSAPLKLRTSEVSQASVSSISLKRLVVFSAMDSTALQNAESSQQSTQDRRDFQS